MFTEEASSLSSISAWNFFDVSETARKSSMQMDARSDIHVDDEDARE